MWRFWLHLLGRTKLHFCDMGILPMCELLCTGRMPVSRNTSFSFYNRIRSGRTYWAVLAFLIGFAILLVGVSTYYLLPAMDAAHSTGVTAKEKRTLMAVSRLMLAVVLFVLFAGLLLTFRVGRFFFPRKTGPRTRTQYVDAWAEAGKRMQPPEE